MLTAIYIGQELRGIQRFARFLRVFEHGTLAGSGVTVELFYQTSFLRMVYGWSFSFYFFMLGCPTG